MKKGLTNCLLLAEGIIRSRNEQLWAFSLDFRLKFRFHTKAAISKASQFCFIAEQQVRQLQNERFGFCWDLRELENSSLHAVI